MSSTFDFSLVGGVQRDATYLAANRMGWGDAVPAGPIWDFGWAPPPFGLSPSAPSFASVAPHLVGGWDGKSISLWEIGKKVTGSYLPAQRQTLGTCVSRGWSASCNLVQLTMIAAGQPDPTGKQLEYHDVAHAAIYGGSREIGGMLARPGNDGSVGQFAAKWVSEYGICMMSDLNDRYDSDKLAGEMGWHGVPSDVKALCKAHPGSVASITSFQEACDAIANGHPVAVCSDQGFTMTRDSDGFDRAYGTWGHCMHFASVIVTPSGRRGLGCGQSWGANNPSGPLLPGAPDHVFGVDETTVNRMLRQNDSYAIAGVTGWAKKDWPLDWVLWS